MHSQFDTRKRSSSDAILPSSDDVGATGVSHSLFRFGKCPRLNTVKGDEAAVTAAAATSNNDDKGEDDAMSVVSIESAPLPSLAPTTQTTPPTEEDAEMSDPAIRSSPPVIKVTPTPDATKQEDSDSLKSQFGAEIAITKHMFKAAQMQFPAQAAVFVGNLPAKHHSDFDLTKLVLGHFCEFGICFGKVERTTSTVKGRVTEKPWAIVQFMARLFPPTIQQAQAAS